MSNFFCQHLSLCCDFFNVSFHHICSAPTATQSRRTSLSQMRLEVEDLESHNAVLSKETVTHNRRASLALAIDSCRGILSDLNLSYLDGLNDAEPMHFRSAMKHLADDVH